MQILYSFLYTIAFLIFLPFFLIIGLIRGKYLSSIKQRFGFIPCKSKSPSIWIHAVSVGEFLAAKPLIKKMASEFPEFALYVSTTTITGQKLARELLPESSFYFPFDWKWSIRKVLRRLQPRLILVMETEIWPNFLWETRRQRIPVVLINGRLSDGSFSRYRLVRPWLPKFDACLMQTTVDSERMKSLGGRHVEVMGNLKFDFRPPSPKPDLARMLLHWKGSHRLWIAGSTMKGEEEMILESYTGLRSKFPLKLMLAPRHPERFAEVERLVVRKQLQCALRSQGNFEDAEVLILDSIGELASCYEFADLVLIGGTLQPGGGGHNPIEAAYFGKPVIAGPFCANFRSVFETFRVNDAILITEDLPGAALQLLTDPGRSDKISNAAAQILKENAGATEKAMQTVRQYLNAGSMVESNSKLSVR